MLDRINWLEISEEQRLGIVNQINKISSEIQYSPESTSAKLGELPFYKEGLLMEIHYPGMTDDQSPQWFLYQEDNIFHLDGSSAPIHYMNDTVEIHITEETVVEYVHFFCFFVHGDEGPFFVVENTDYPAFDKAKMDVEKLKLINDHCTELKLDRITEKGVFEVVGTILYGNALFGARFAVTNNGMIEIIDDEPYVADIPARKIKPNY